MADNLYEQEPESHPGLVRNLLLPVGVFEGHRWTTRALVGTRRMKRYKERYSRLGAWWRARKRANREASEVWGSFARGEGLVGRYTAAERVASRQVLGGMRLRPSFFRKTRIAGEVEGIARGMANKTVPRAITRRTVAGLLRGPLGIANAYFTIGSWIPDIAEAAVAGFSALQKFGATLRKSTPETGERMYMNPEHQQRAFTMRQASEMALHMSQLGARAALGNEASFLHA